MKEVEGVFLSLRFLASSFRFSLLVRPLQRGVVFEVLERYIATVMVVDIVVVVVILQVTS